MTRQNGRESSALLPDRLHAGEQEKNAGYHLVELYDAYLRLLQSRTHSSLMNLTLTQWRTLTLIRFNPDQTQRTVSRAVGIDPSSMTPIIDVFEKKGWVRRHQSSMNRSAYDLRMTAAGLKAYQQIEREIGRAERLIRDLLGETDRRTLLTLMNKLHSGLAQRVARIEE